MRCEEPSWQPVSAVATLTRMVAEQLADSRTSWRCWNRPARAGRTRRSSPMRTWRRPCACTGKWRGTRSTCSPSRAGAGAADTYLPRSGPRSTSTSPSCTPTAGCSPRSWPWPGRSNRGRSRRSRPPLPNSARTPCTGGSGAPTGTGTDLAAAHPRATWCAMPVRCPNAARGVSTTVQTKSPLSRTPTGSAGGECLVGGVVDREDPGQAGDPQDLQDRIPGADQVQGTRAGRGPASGHRSAPPGRWSRGTRRLAGRSPGVGPALLNVSRAANQDNLGRAERARVASQRSSVRE